MRTTTLATIILALATTVAASPAWADTVAADSPPVVLAQDTTPDPSSLAPASPAPASIPATLVGIDATPVNALTVTGHGGRLVRATAPGQRTRTVTVAAGRPAVLRNLAPGVRYTVSIAGRRIGTAIPLGQVGAAAGLTVQTTPVPGTVLVTWTHAARTGEGDDVTFDVTATPINADGTDATGATGVVTVVATGTTVTVESLSTTARYRFTVTPRNAASTGRASTAAMSRTLADIAGPTAPEPPVVPAPSPPAPAPPPAPTPAPAPVSAPGPVAPATKTIYVCPAGSTPHGELCRTVTQYTFDIKAYTYHPESYAYTAYGAPYVVRTGESGPGPTCAPGWSPAWDTDPVLGSVNPHCEQTRQDAYTATGIRNVKDATPAGYTDTGTTWTRKDAPPTGYTDDGTQWVKDAPKVAQVVPA
ncbi:MAG: fibronectin type III domain-containing protein [Actinomycetota bacterium]|nr:fibronectin type III domain-containing protein [Actinomycetota bacterium]